MAVERIDYQGGSAGCCGALVYDERISGRRPLLLMAPNWLGVTDDAIKRAEMMAGSKYVVFVADMYGGAKICSGPPEAGPLADGAARRRARAPPPHHGRARDAAAGKRQARHRRSHAAGGGRLLLRRRQCAGTRARRRRRAGGRLPARRSHHHHAGQGGRHQSRGLRAARLEGSGGAEGAPRHRWKPSWRRAAPNGRCWCSAACCIRSARARPTCRASPATTPAQRARATT